MNNQHDSSWRHAPLLGTLLLAVVFAACSADHTGVGPAPEAGPVPIVFAVSSDVPQGSSVTRGELSNALSGDFGLLAAKYEASDFGDGQPMNFMYNQMAINSGHSFMTEEGFFVPSSQYNLKFFAYYPFYDDIRTGASPIEMSASDLSVYPYFAYTMPRNAEDQDDLMWAVSDQVSADAANKLDTVRLQFHHLLTGLTIAAKSSEPGYIRRVTLTNLWSKAMFNYKTQRLTTYVDEEKTSVYSDLDLKLEAGTDFQRPYAWKSFLLLPQRNTDGTPALLSTAELQVQFEASGKIFTFTTSLEGLKEQLATPGKNILLRLSVTSLQRMSLSATITGWENGANYDGAVSDQPPIDLGTAISDWTDEAGNTTNIVTGPQPY